MKETVVQIDEQMQVAKSKNSKYLTFIFFERDHGLDLEVVGWTRFQEQTDVYGNVRGIVRLWEYEIPTMLASNSTCLTETSCIIIFEYSEPYRHYQGIVVDAFSNVMNIAEKDAASSAIIETEIEDQLGGKQIQYNIAGISKTANITVRNY